jgi:hypothetical protein
VVGAKLRGVETLAPEVAEEMLDIKPIETLLSAAPT